MPGRSTLTATSRPSRVDGEVHLGDRGGGDRLLVEAAEQRFERLAELLFDGRAHLVEGEGRQPVLQARRGRAAMSSPSRSDRLASAWPNLMNDGPASCSARASRCPGRSPVRSRARAPAAAPAHSSGRATAKRSRTNSASCRASRRASSSSRAGVAQTRIMPMRALAASAGGSSAGRRIVRCARPNAGRRCRPTGCAS